MSEARIVNVEAFDGDCFGVTLSSGHTILLELGGRARELSFAALIERGVFDKPQTDGERIFWQDGPAFTVTEILAMVAQGGGDLQASVSKNKEASTPAKKNAHDIVINTPVVIILGLLFSAGAAAFVIGLKKLKTSK
ncbi:MAG: hypothetical protein LBH21_01285 [Gracilibacteraceae bacterium]|jgi:hypothetical protein|nr:hypothetical protein [Gracilibacteraceae bacterium]